MSKKLLFVFRTPPYGNQLAREALDMALACAAFEQPVAIYFCGAGVWQLLPQQEPASIGQKNLGAALSALPMYDIEEIYVDAEALQSNGIATETLALDYRPMQREEFPALADQFDVVLNF